LSLIDLVMPERGDHRGDGFEKTKGRTAEPRTGAFPQRTRAGLTAPRRRGRSGGRKRLMTPGKFESARKLLGSGMAPGDVAQNLGVSIPTLYRWIPAASR
jgi:hypothetical protein